MSRIFKYLFLTGVFFLQTTNSYPQDTTDVEVVELKETYRVQWVSQIPSLKGNQKRPHKGWFKRLILGKKDITTFLKPIHLIGMDTVNCIVLDQGYGTIFFAEEGKLNIPKVFRKQKRYFPSIISTCLLPNNELLFTDSRLNEIFVLSENKKNLHPLNESLKLKQPTGIAYSKVTDQIWVVETGAHQIVILDRNGQKIRTIGQRGLGEAEFNYPTSIWIDQKGMAYVVDALNYRIQIFDSHGDFVSMFGENGDGTGYFASPKGIATDSYGHIYVADALFHGIQVFDFQGNYLYQFGKQGRDKEQFWMPSGIYIDKKNYIYIADSYNSRIQIFQLIKSE